MSAIIYISWMLSRSLGGSIVPTIAGVGVAVSGERVRDGLGSESLWYRIASDNAAIFLSCIGDIAEINSNDSE